MYLSTKMHLETMSLTKITVVDTLTSGCNSTINQDISDIWVYESRISLHGLPEDF